MNLIKKTTKDLYELYKTSLVLNPVITVISTIITVDFAFEVIKIFIG